MNDDPTRDRAADCLSYALQYAARGWPVFPVRAYGKAPLATLAPNGVHTATTDTSQITKWWTTRPDANVAIATGTEARLGVLDIDTRNDGFASLDALVAQHTPFPATFSVCTGGGGRHYYFTFPAHAEFSNRAAARPGIDFKWSGGYVVAPPSVHESGRAYEVLDNVNVTPAPEWLVTVLKKPKRERKLGGALLRTHGAIAWADAALTSECERVAVAPEGERNDTLNTAGFNLGQIVGGGYLDRERVRDELLLAAETCGLIADDGEHACTRTMESGLAAGELEPRHPPLRAASDLKVTFDNQNQIDPERVFVVAEQLPPMVDAVMTAVANGDLRGVYVRGRPGELVRLCRDAPAPRGINRAPGAPTIQAIPPVQLQLELERMGQWVRVKREPSKAGYIVPSAPPQKLVEYVRTVGMWPGIPMLEGITEAPCLRRDGSILDTPGYDNETGLLYEPSTQFPVIQTRPTLDDAREAVSVLLDPLVDFKFISLCDQAAAVAATLTIVARHAITGCVPVFVVRATTPGEGKGLLSDVLSIEGTGRPAARLVADGNDTELRKLITAVAIDGSPVVLIDNVTGDFGSPAFSSAVTASTWSDRILGESRKIECPLRCVWLVNGNNVRFRGDLGRRVVVIDLDSGLEHPEDRPSSAFTHPGVDGLLAHVSRERPKLLAAALTILRAYHVAGRPAHGFSPKGGFESWDSLVRGACLWTGVLDDPDGGKIRVREDDDADTATLGAALAATEQHFGDHLFSAAELARAAGDPNTPQLLRDAVAEWAGDRKGAITGRSVGNKLKANRGRIVNGLRFAHAGRGHEARLWTVRGEGAC
jgi:Bifunctional DNA primase/polymerase, N-terminal